MKYLGALFCGAGGFCAGTAICQSSIAMASYPVFIAVAVFVLGIAIIRYAT